MASDLFDLTGKAALITGGGRGIGRAVAKELAKAGADVVLASRTEKELKDAVEEIRALGKGKAEYVVTDMTDRAQVKALGDKAMKLFGKVDILFNNAGTNKPQPCDQVTDEVWDMLVELNFNSCMALTRAVVPGMKERKWGRIIYTASLLATVGNPDRAAYCGTKAGLVGMAHSQATELGPYNITVNCISPGPVATELPMSVLTEEQKKIFAGRTCLGRWGQPEEMTGPVLMLASEAGSYITGADIKIDGGSTIKCF